MSTGGVLRTRVDSLQWEVNRLDSENQRLRSQNPESASRVELEDELQRVKEDAANVQQLLDTAREEMEPQMQTRGTRNGEGRAGERGSAARAGGRDTAQRSRGCH